MRWGLAFGGLHQDAVLRYRAADLIILRCTLSVTSTDPHHRPHFYCCAQLCVGVALHRQIVKVSYRGGKVVHVVPAGTVVSEQR